MGKRMLQDSGQPVLPAAVFNRRVFLGAGAVAEDVVQQAFVKAYCALGRFRDGAAF